MANKSIFGVLLLLLLASFHFHLYVVVCLEVFAYRPFVCCSAYFLCFLFTVDGWRSEFLWFLEQFIALNGTRLIVEFLGDLSLIIISLCVLFDFQTKKSLPNCANIFSNLDAILKHWSPSWLSTPLSNLDDLPQTEMEDAIFEIRGYFQIGISISKQFNFFPFTPSGA